jgi:hypothetical protein
MVIEQYLKKGEKVIFNFKAGVRNWESGGIPIKFALKLSKYYTVYITGERLICVPSLVSSVLNKQLIIVPFKWIKSISDRKKCLIGTNLGPVMGITINYQDNNHILNSLAITGISREIREKIKKLSKN